uniref:Uncharacterized protein n=1 Tax=Hyaloperonospora arabidopsidis (strain Emoy2) TaxID=559515 RepID=M4BHY6_HYAAE
MGSIRKSRYPRNRRGLMVYVHPQNWCSGLSRQSLERETLCQLEEGQIESWQKTRREQEQLSVTSG